MAKKSAPKTTYSVRLAPETVDALQQRASERRISVGAIIRSSIMNYLDDREGEDYLAEMEARIVATIRSLDKHQWQVKRVAELTLAEVDFVRRFLARCMKMLGNAKEEEIRQEKVFRAWLPRALASGYTRKLIKSVTEPPIILEEPEEDASGEDPVDPMAM